MSELKKKLYFLIIGVLFTGYYCEFLIYYIVIRQCSWPVLENFNNSENTLKAFILADTHLLGPYRGHWLDKWRREWQMSQAFKAIMHYHEPEAVFFLGDLFDEGEWADQKQFSDYVNRFYKLFPVTEEKSMHIVAGNHDIGFHNYYRSQMLSKRFVKSMNASSVQFFTLKHTNFLLINSMAMQGDNCNMCMEARKEIDKISGMLSCSKASEKCDAKFNKGYIRPILMQHFPLHRKSDSMCTEPDAPPLKERNKPFRRSIDSLSLEATEYLLSKIKPRVVFGGHTHHGCLIHHSRNAKSLEFDEYSVPSFSWRNRMNPKYMLVTITPDEYKVNKCELPTEITIVTSAVVLLSTVAWYTSRRVTNNS